MRKLVFLFPFLLYSCFGESQEVQDAKQQLLSGTLINETQTGGMVSETSNTSLPSYTLEYLTDKFIEIDPIVNIDSLSDKIDVTGKVLNADIDKIVVTFENSTSQFPTDRYVLKSFKKGDATFLYRMHTQYQVLDVGENNYMIEGYIGDQKVASIRMQVHIPSITSQKVSTQVFTGSISSYVGVSLGDEFDSVFLQLPVDETIYGSPVVDGNTGFTYSKIPDLVVYKRGEGIDLNCSNVGDYLKQNYSWYYWNQCVPIQDDSFSFYSLTLIGDTYKYEKHYVDFKYNLYGVLLLEEGTGILQNDLEAKAEELKQKTFVGIGEADKLFQDILKGKN